MNLSLASFLTLPHIQGHPFNDIKKKKMKDNNENNEGGREEGALSREEVVHRTHGKGCIQQDVGRVAGWRVSSQPLTRQDEKQG